MVSYLLKDRRQDHLAIYRFGTWYEDHFEALFTFVNWLIPWLPDKWVNYWMWDRTEWYREWYFHNVYVPYINYESRKDQELQELIAKFEEFEQKHYGKFMDFM
jgi:hypothetical protein